MSVGKCREGTVLCRASVLNEEEIKTVHDSTNKIAATDSNTV